MASSAETNKAEDVLLEGVTDSSTKNVSGSPNIPRSTFLHCPEPSCSYSPDSPITSSVEDDETRQGSSLSFTYKSHNIKRSNDTRINVDDLTETDLHENKFTSEYVDSINISASSSTVVLSDFYDRNVKKIIEMGYDRNHVEKALRKSLNDPDRAIEYLLSDVLLEGVTDSSTKNVSGSPNIPRSTFLHCPEPSCSYSPDSPITSSVEDDETRQGSSLSFTYKSHNIKRSIDTRINVDDLTETDLHENKFTSEYVDSINISASSSTVVLSDFYDRNVEKIIEMGYDRNNVEKALRKSLNDPDRAIEYLLSDVVKEGALDSSTKSNVTASPNVPTSSFLQTDQPSCSYSTGSPSTSSVEDDETRQGLSMVFIDMPHKIKRTYDASINLDDLTETDLHENKKVSRIQKNKVKVEGTHMTKAFIKKHFSQFGHLQNIELNENCAVLTYSKKDEASAMYAICFNDSTLDGIKVNVSLISEYETQKEQRNLFSVKIIYDGKITYRNVKTYFESIGKPIKIYINELNRYGFVTFKNQEEVDRALKLSGKIINKTKLFIYSLNKREKKTKRDEKEDEGRERKEEEKKKKEQENKKKFEEDKEKKAEKDKTEEEEKNEFQLNFYKDRNLF